MDKKKKPIDVSKYQKGGPITLDEVTVVDSAPSWLRYKREYEENNPKEKFIESYLNPFAKSLGNTKANYPKRLDTEYEKQALDFVAERLLDPAGVGSFKTKTKADRLSLYDRFSDKEREIIKNSKYANRFLPAERENSIRISNDANENKRETFTTEGIGKSVEGTPNRFRFFGNARHSVEDFINPGIWVGEMAKNLGQSLSPMEEGNYKPAISAIAAPLALGALGFSPVHSLAKGIDKGIANVASKKELYLRGYNEGNVGVNIKPVSKTLSKDEFTKLRDIQSLKSLSMEPEIKRETLVKRYLKSSLDDAELKRLTSKTRQELESELKELTAVKKSSEETVESVGSYVRPEHVTQELYRRPQLPPLPDYVNLPNLRNVRNGYDFNLDRTYRTIINPNQDLQYYINQHNNNRGVGTKVMQALDMPVVDILPTAPNISNMIYKAGKKHGARKSELNMDKTLVSLNTTNENPKPLLPTLFKTVSSQKDVMRKINDAFATLKSSEKGLYDASGSLSDSSAPLYYRKASSLSNTPKIDFEFKGFNSLNDFGHLKKSGVENEKILDFINTQIKDLDFNGKKLPAAYLDEFGNIQIPELVIRKFQQGGMTKKPIIKKYPGGGPIGNYPDAINDWKEYNNYVPTNDPVVVPFTESAEVPFIQASPYMGALLEGNMNEKNMKRSDVFNPIQGFHGYNYQMGGDVNINTSGYTPGYPSFDNPENTIPLGPSKTITMKNTPFPVLAIPDVGEPVILKPGEVRKFKDATKVREIPMKNNKFQLGGTTPMGAPQGQPSQNPFDNIPNKFNNQTEDPFVLASYLPYILGDSRNTLNAGKRPLAPIQTEDGEMITSPLGDMVDVAATKAHKNMESDEITDFSAEGNYILSDDKNMIIKKGKDGGVVNGINLKDVLIGMDSMYYKEGELIKTPKEYTLEDIAPKKNKYTFAELGKNVQRHFPLSTEENDIFAKRAQVENKLSRVPYINSIIELSEIKKQSMNKKGSPANFKQGGYASMAKIYNPALKSLGNTLADGSTNGFYFEPDPQLNPKRDNNFKTPTYQGGGYTYDDRERGQNKREQWNYWVDQTQDHFNDFEQDSQRNNQAMFGVNALGILGQSAYQGDNDYLYGNAYNSKMDNLSNKVDRSFGAEQSYNEGLVGRENSAYRMGLNTGATPNDFAPSRANALREQGSMNNNLNKERRSYMDRYGTMDAQSSDMFAGRRNQQKAYLNDFSNNQVQNLAGAGTGYLQNKIGIQAANLQAQSSLQLMKQAGNGWTDFTNGLGDVINVVAGLAGAITGMGFGGGGNKSSEQTPQQQQTMNGLNPTNWGGSNMFQYNSQLYGSNPWSGYNPNSQPYQPSWNENRGWGSGGPG